MSIKSNERVPVPFSASIIVVIFIAVSLYIGLFILKVEAHIPLFISVLFAAIIAMLNGYKWKDLEEGINKTVSTSAASLFILLAVGVVVGVWTLAGVVPSFIYYGLQIVSPQLFLPSAAIITAITTLLTGSSWSTAGTIGLALMAIGNSLGFNPGLSAGAIISGAYFGDKLSPISDTTTLASGISNVNLFDHIKHMLYTTIPSFTVSLIIYFFISWNYNIKAFDPTYVESILSGISQNFHISPILLIPVILVIILIILKVPAVGTLLISAIVAGIMGIIFQGSSLSEVFSAAHYGFSSETGIEIIDKLLSGGGLNSMLNSISLFVIALGLAGIMESSGMISSLNNKIIKLAKGTFGLIAATGLTVISSLLITGDQYLGIILPGKIYVKEYLRRGISLKNLSRTLEDFGTAMSSLIPWGACGVFMSSTLGVSTFSYAPFAFFCFLSPIFALIYAATGFGIAKASPEELSLLEDEEDVLANSIESEGKNR
ncbi:Na+/H+ antiporter NhaC [Fastidiosipila sanguinis]|uniref:Na+/H+ antiporter NhaC n=1 Tax=Fastidiosipila sanguinis TaxID=236753 RepID=A0A2S0KPG8_9FIRM|nr:Na+/H+ antiporter NhaC [Fastidiosipila sanguinis]AVM42908.1 Na+/H+ antiporter NhaC [Fastidiosipila sanguinis]